jgi:transglutaminase-like putative cysteine protease
MNHAMNLGAPINFPDYAANVWWVMVAGCAARFSAERSGGDAAASFSFWVVMFAVCWILRASLSRTPDSLPKLEKAGNAVAVVGMVLFVLQLNAGGIMPALLTLLIATQAAMFVVAARRLHILLIIAAAFGNVLFAAAESRSALFLLCAAWFTLAVLAALAFDVRTTRAAATVAKSATTLRTSSGNGAFASVVLLVAIPLYLFLPKPDGLMLGGLKAQSAHDYREYGQGQQRESGKSAPDEDIVPQESPSERGNTSDSTTTESAATPTESESEADNFDVSKVQRDRAIANNIVMYVKSSQPVNLRGNIYDRFANNRWYRDQHEAERHELVSGNWERADTRGSTSIQQTIEVVSDIDAVLVHAPGLSRLRFPAPSIREYDDGVFELPRAIRADTAYSVESRIDVFDGRYVDVSPRRRLMTQYLLLPDNASDRMQALAQQVTANATTATEKAFALEKHLRENYQYSFDTIQYQGYTPLDWFLFEGKRGHCEYFASALAVMLRSVGVPSRLTTGFSLGERNPMTGYYEVRTMNGHAWVEAYIPDRGWMMLEPTPFFPLPTPESRSQVAAELDRYLDALAEQGETVDPESLKTQIVGGIRDAWAVSRHVSKQITLQVAALGWWLPVGIALAIVSGLCAYLAWQFALDIRSNQQVQKLLLQQQGGSIRDATLATATALDLASAHRGFERRPHQTMQQYVGYLHELDAATPREFADVFDSVRYGDEESQVSANAIGNVAALVRNSIVRDAYPRLVGALKRWQASLRGMMSGR